MQVLFDKRCQAVVPVSSVLVKPGKLLPSAVVATAMTSKVEPQGNWVSSHKLWFVWQVYVLSCPLAEMLYEASCELGLERKTLYVEMLVCTIFKISGEHGAAGEDVLLRVSYFFKDICRKYACLINSHSTEPCWHLFCASAAHRSGCIL